MGDVVRDSCIARKNLGFASSVVLQTNFEHRRGRWPGSRSSNFDNTLNSNDDRGDRDKHAARRDFYTTYGNVNNSGCSYRTNVNTDTSRVKTKKHGCADRAHRNDYTN